MLWEYPIVEEAVDDAMENIVEPPAKVAKTVSTVAGGNLVPSPKTSTPATPAKSEPSDHWCSLLRSAASRWPRL